MMMFAVYTLEQSEVWDAIVRSFKEYDVYWLSGYVKAFQIHGDGEPLLFYYENGTTRGINAVMKRDVAKDERFKGRIPSNKYFDFATPYGYGGWLVENQLEANIFELFNEYSEFCRRHNVVSEFVRFHPLLRNHELMSSFYDVIPLGGVVTLELSSPEVIWNNFSSTCRNRVRKSIKSGAQVYHGNYPEVYDVFQKIYNKTMDHDNADIYYYFKAEFYESILKDLSNNAQVFYTQIPDGTITAAAIMLTANGKMNYHLGGSLHEYSEIAPMNQLFYKAALWGCANGYQTLENRYLIRKNMKTWFD